MNYTYTPHGTCSTKIEFELNDGIISHLRFRGGCNGNASGISRLVDGMKATEVIARLKGVRCGMRPTSCPDQMARALEDAMQKEATERCRHED